MLQPWGGPQKLKLGLHMIQNFPSEDDPEYWKQGRRPSYGHTHGCHDPHML